MEVKIPEVQLIRKRSDPGDLISASTERKLPTAIIMNIILKALPQQATQSGMTTVLGLLKSGKLILRCTSDRGDPMKLLGEQHEKFDLVSLTRKPIVMVPRNPL